MAKSMVEVDKGSHPAAMQNADHDPGAALITAMTKVMSVQSTDLGDDIKSLAPAGMLQQASHPEDPPLEGKDTINLMLQTAGQQEKGLPPAKDEAADKDFHRPNGSDIDDDDDDDYENPHGIDWNGGNASESDQDLPFNSPLSPFTTAREFGIQQKTSDFLGLPNLSDAELIVPALRLDLDTATPREVESVLSEGLFKLEKKYGQMGPETHYRLQAGVMKIRRQMLLAQQKREEVWCHITNKKGPQHVCTEPEMRLSLEDVKYWMRHLRAQFEAEESQVRVQKSLHICKDLELYVLR